MPRVTRVTTTTRRRRRRVRRVKRTVRARRLIPQSVHVFKRICGFPSNASLGGSGLYWVSSLINGSNVSVAPEGVLFTTGSAGISNFTYYTYALAFSIDLLPDYAEFTNLFQQYKILKMELTMVPYQHVTMHVSTVTPGNQSAGALHYSYLDFEDANPPAATLAGLNFVRQQVGVKRLDYFRRFRRVLKAPKVASVVYGGLVSSDYAVAAAPWISSVSSDVLHYGFKGLFQVFSPDITSPTNLWFRPELNVTFATKRIQ